MTVKGLTTCPNAISASKEASDQIEMSSANEFFRIGRCLGGGGVCGIRTRTDLRVEIMNKFPYNLLLHICSKKHCCC